MKRLILLSAMLLAGCSSSAGDEGSAASASPDTGSPDVAVGDDVPAAPDVAPDTVQAEDTGPQDVSDAFTADTVTRADAGAPPDSGEPPPVTTEHSFETSDGKTLTALLHRRSGAPPNAPGVLLIHQFTQTKNQWDAYVTDLLDAGFVALAFDLRGHGGSSPQDGAFNSILTDPEQAPLDVQAALAWFKANGGIAADRVAVVGTSIGANLACVAMANGYGVKLSVAVSPRQSSVEALADKSGLMFQSLYCLATANDGQGAQAATCQAFTEASGEPKATIVIPDSGAHGSGLLSGFPEEWAKIVTYLTANL
jgi:dienelactone hydrolase